jgi:hypothetical protein
MFPVFVFVCVFVCLLFYPLFSIGFGAGTTFLETARTSQSLNYCRLVSRTAQGKYLSSLSLFSFYLAHTHTHTHMQSTLMCPSTDEGGCARVSVTFDPFAYLSVPVSSQESQLRFVEVALFRDPLLQDGPW